MPNSTLLSRGTTRILVFGLFTALGLLMFLHYYLDDLSRARPGSLWPRLIEEMTAAYAAAVLIPLITKFARHFRLSRNKWPSRLPLHLVALCGFSVLHTTLNAVSRYVIFLLAGLGAYDYGIMALRYPMEFATDTIIYGLTVALVYLFDHYVQSRDRELKAAQLETRLAEAQLQALKLQLQPHFLFNTLNTISSVIYEDVQAADKMIARLSDFLRLTLRSSRSQEVTLQEELDFLHQYIEIMRARLEERLNVTVEVAQGIQDALVPQLILQPLVENSIRHAADAVTGAVTIQVRAARENGALVLEVRDTGPGMSAEQCAAPAGIGLSNTAARLNQLYGSSHRFDLENGATGGLIVRACVPYHVLPAGGRNGVSA
jgi:two-component system LytT family sensor kinase